MDRLKRIIFIGIDSLLMGVFLSKSLFGRDISTLDFYTSPRFFVISILTFVFLTLLQHFYPCKEKQAERKFIFIASMVLLVLFILQLFPLKFLQFKIIDFRWLLTSWQLGIVATSIFIGTFLSLRFYSNDNQKVNLKWPTIIFMLSSVTYIIMCLRNHITFGTPARDLGIFDQAIWNLSVFKAPASTIRGYANLWGDHWHPILTFFAPLFWIWDDVRAVLIAQAMVVSAGVYGVYLLAVKILKHNFLALALSLTYVFYGGIQHALNFGFYPENIAPALILASLAALFWNRILLYFIFFFLALLTKENIALYFAAFSIILFFATEKKKIAVYTMLISLAYFLASYKIILPFFSGSDSYQYANLYSNFGDTPTEIIKGILTRPLFVIETMFNPTIKLDTITTILSSLLFLPITSFWGLLLIPNLFENFLSGRFVQWPFGYHYQAGIIAFAIFATIMSLSRITQKFSGNLQNRLKFLFGFALILALVFLNYTYKFPITNILSYTSQDFSQDKEITKILKMIPKNASVSAQNTLAPHLTHRQTIYHFPDINESEYVVLSPTLSPFPFTKEELDLKINELKLSLDWVTVSENEKVVLFRRK